MEYYKSKSGKKCNCGSELFFIAPIVGARCKGCKSPAHSNIHPLRELTKKEKKTS